MVVHPVHGYKIKPQEDVKTVKRNARERHRVQNVNSGFSVLKQHLPGTAHLKKVSKVTILTHAMEYIAYLTRVLHSQQGHGQTMVFSQFSAQRTMEQQQGFVPTDRDSDVQLQSYTSSGQTSDWNSESDNQPSPGHGMISPQLHERQSMHRRMHALHSPAMTGHAPMHAMQSLPPAPYSPASICHSPSLLTQSSAVFSSVPASSFKSSVLSSTAPLPSPPVHPYYSSSSHLPPPPPLVSSTTSNHEDHDVSSGEEEDILDAIAEWQQV
jgi:hypothetical protein